MKNELSDKSRIELWQTTYLWLKANGNKLNSNYCKEEITTHPNYPSLLSAIDFLDAGNMDYKAVQADASYIHEFNYPLLAHIRQPGDEHMHIIFNAAEWDQQEEITKHWTGIVVYPGKNPQWKNEQDIIYQRIEKKNKLIAFALSLTGISLFIISIIQFSNFLINTFGLLSIAGLIISLAALATELGFQNEIVNQVCGTVSKGGCERILKSKYAKGFAGITPSDVSVLYFSVQFVIYLLGCTNPLYFQSIFLFAFAGIGIAAWSIYTQAAKLKQWCALCLGIVSMLVSQGIIAFFAITQLRGILPEIIFIAVFGILALVLLPIKQLIKINHNNKLKLAELKKWKLDGDLFITQWKQEKEVDTTIWHNDLLLGDPAAPLQITVACNLYCGPCAKAHVRLDNLLHRFGNKIKIQIRLLCNEGNENDKRNMAAKAILQRAFTIQNNMELQQMLTDWFDWMDYDKWQLKWQSATLRERKSSEIERVRQHRQWIEQNHISSTPTFFINGRKLPGRYSIYDLGILIPQLSELINEEALN